VNADGEPSPGAAGRRIRARLASWEATRRALHLAPRAARGDRRLGAPERRRGRGGLRGTRSVRPSPGPPAARRDCAQDRRRSDPRPGRRYGGSLRTLRARRAPDHPARAGRGGSFLLGARGLRPRVGGRAVFLPGAAVDRGVPVGRLSVSWRQAKQKMLERGAWPASHVPFGYRRARSGRLVPDSHTGPYVTELYRRRAAGTSVADLCRFLETAGVRTPRGNTGWARGSLENIFRHRAYLGEIQWGSAVRMEAHEPLIDGSTWERAQRPPTARRREAERPGPLLRGLVRCASCSMSMVFREVRVPGGRVYGSYDCQGRSAAGPCPARAYINAPPFEGHVIAEAFRILALRRPRRPVAVTRAEQRLQIAERALRRYRDNDRLLDRLDPDVFADGVLLRDERVRAARLAVALAREADDLHELPPAAALRERWPSMSVTERRTTIARVIDCVFVSPGRLPLADRVTICSAGTAPTQLPRSGDKKARARPFRPRADRRSRRTGTRPADRWSNARLERELHAFLDGLPNWPNADVFVRAGRGDLLQQARLRGRDEWWAFHFRLPMQDPPGPTRPWSESRIREELTTFLRGDPCGRPRRSSAPPASTRCVKP
jgi:hypothetical protein